MLYFLSDYTEGAHPRVLQKLIDTNLISIPGYGTDPYCTAAKDKIRSACGRDVDVHFLTGGTQANQVVISAMLKPWQGVVAAVSGHIAGHEAGAVESTGHKVLTVPQREGKVTAEALQKLVSDFYAEESFDHMVFPGMVYISHPTEYGTLYSKAELAALSRVCRENDLPLFMDGARLGYGLMSPASDLTMEDIVALTDVFYIGGTKVGALCGEAVVFTHGNTPEHFFTYIKQHGALLAKSRLIGMQFDALFTDGLYFEIGRHAIDLAMRLKEIFIRKGYELYMDSPTNQQFVILTREQEQRLRRDVAFNITENLTDGREVCRFVTSWATRDEDIDGLEKLL